jgi:hypothetical protein
MVLSFTDDLVIQEAASETFKKGMPLNVDLSASGSTVVELKTNDGDYSDVPVLIAATDALNNSTAVDLTQPGTNKASLPYINRPGEIWSVGISSGGTDAAPSGDYIGGMYGWIKHGTSSSYAVLDVANTTNAHFQVIGFDDRDSAGTSGGRMLVMYIPGLLGTNTKPDVT